MTRNRTSVSPNLDAVPRLEIFEERAVPAQIGAPALGVMEHGQLQQVADGFATVDTLLHNRPDVRLKSWLNEDSLFVDGPGHSEIAPGQLKKADHVALNNQGTLAALDSTLANFISYFTKQIEHAKKETQSKSDGPTTPSSDDGQSTQDGQGEQGGQGGSDTPGSRPGPVGRTPESKPGAGTPAATTPDDSRADTPKTDPTSAPAPTGEDHKVDHAHVTAHADSTYSLIMAPVSAVANMAAAISAVNPAQATEFRSADSPLAGQRAAALVPDLTAAPAESGTEILDGNVIPAAGVAADPAAGPAPAPVADSAWAPAVGQVNDLVSRFVPLDPGAVEQSVDQFLDHLREARELTLTPRQACLLTVAVFAGLAGGEVARRQRLPQRVSQMLTRSRFFSRTKTV